MYNITIRDISRCHISRDPTTNEDVIDEKPLKQGDKDHIPRSFDVTKNGEYLGMPRIQEFMA